MQANVVANLPGQQRMLLRRIVADQQDRGRVIDIAHAGSRAGFAGERRGESRKIGRTVVVDVVGLQHHARELLQQIALFIGGSRRADHADRLTAVLIANFRKAPANQLECLFPCRRGQPAIAADKRLLNTFLAVGEVKSVAALDAEEIAVNAALVAIISADNFHAAIETAYAQSCFAAVAAVGTSGAHVLHLPGPGLVAIRARGQRAHGADIDAHAAFFALQVVLFVGSDNRVDATVLNAQRPDVHSFAANAHTPVAQDAAWPVKVHDRRPLLLFAVLLEFHEPGFGSAVSERHVLQFALATGVADRAIQRMIPEQQLDHPLAGLADLIAGGGHDHAFADDRGAGGLQLGDFFNLDQAHAACALQGKVWVIAERGHFDAHTLAGFDQQRPCGCRDLLGVYRNVYRGH